MTHPRLFLLVAALALCFSATALASDPSALLPAGWSHAQINVIGPNGRPHTQIYDRGRVQVVGPSSLTLLERDGSVVTIQVAPAAVIRVNGQAGTLAQILPGYTATTLGLDGRPAQRVQATQPPKPVVPKRLLKHVIRKP
jgi:hypothetical protein